jgi:hypothetical protein
MGTATLDVWVTRVGDPCRIDMEHQWYVHVLHCDGSLLEWCDREYTNIETKCGHVEIEVPPGAYTVVATWSPGTPHNPHALGNHLTHMQVVRVNCDDHECVTLFPPTVHFCGFWFIVAAQVLLRAKMVEPGAARAAIEAVEAFVGTIEADPFTEATKRLAAVPEQQPKTRRTKGR